MSQTNYGTNQISFSGYGTSIDHDPAIFLNRADLDLVGFLVHSNDGMLIVDSKKEKNQGVLEHNYKALYHNLSVGHMNLVNLFITDS
jgi:hypothetical protein